MVGYRRTRKDFTVASRNMKFWTWLLLLWVGANFPAWALDPQQPLTGLQIERWYSDEGLPHNTVHSMVQTSDGYLWLATWEGLARYNGREFRRFRAEDFDARLEDGFRALHATPDGTLWAASVRNGLFRWEDQRWTHYGKAEGLVDETLYSLAPAVDGLWIGTRNSGLMHRDPEGRIRHYDVSSGLGAAWVHVVLDEGEGVVWAGTAKGLYRKLGERWVDANEGLPADSVVHAILRDRRGRLWVGCNSGLYVLDEGRFVAHPRVAGQLRTVSALLEDRDGNLWAGSQSEGLWRVAGRGLQSLTAAQGLSNNRVTALLEDREGSLWVSTNAGLNRLGDSTFRTYTRFDGLRDNFVRSISEGPSGMWIGTSQGLHLLDAQGLRVVGEGQLSSPSVMAVIETRERALWVGTYDGGVGLREGERWRTLGEADGLPSMQVRALLETRNGAVWVGTTRGAVRYAAGSAPVVLNAASGLPSDYVLSLAELRDGRLLLGTPQGFAEWQLDGQIRIHRGSPGLPYTEVFGFAETEAGVWVGTDAGLLHWQGEQQSFFTRADGLPDDAVFAVIPDGARHLFLTTNAGLVRLDRGVIQPGRRLDIEVYTHEDGLAGTQINGSSQPSAWRSRSGHLWLPTARGVSQLDLNRRGDSGRGMVPVVIESVRVDGAKRPPMADMVIDAGARRIRLEYAGLSFLRANLLRYRHRLIGFDSEWSAPRVDNAVEFTNLPAGLYRFELQAGEASFDASPIAVLAFRVLPRFWQRWWFFPMLGGLLLLGVFGLHQVRLRALQARSRALERQVEERTAELQARNDALERSDRDKSALLKTIQSQAAAFAQQAREDALTGLYNRRHFDQLFAREFDRQRANGLVPMAALLDVDHFKQVNDAWSHQAGDDVLRAVGAVLERQMQGVGICARYGGEEFALFFTIADPVQAQAVLEAIRAEIAALRLPAYPGLVVTVSIGFSALHDALNHEKLLADADRQLYVAKRGGRNQVRSDGVHTD